MVYSSVFDMDLYAGGSLESELSETVLGPTFVCIINEQFEILKNRDHFFYDRPAPSNRNPFGDGM